MTTSSFGGCTAVLFLKKKLHLNWISQSVHVPWMTTSSFGGCTAVLFLKKKLHLNRISQSVHVPPLPLVNATPPFLLLQSACTPSQSEIFSQVVIVACSLCSYVCICLPGPPHPPKVKYSLKTVIVACSMYLYFRTSTPSQILSCLTENRTEPVKF